MAMMVINKVPTISGTMPKAPEDPTWSARMAVCGDHCRPKRKSIGEILLKNCAASKTTDSNMPMVVRTATAEQASRTYLTKRSN